ncbi:actin related protein 2/3 complex, putative [Leishmania panamensis]|uniref:Arp2/3 complex 41 kDa subunit n=1 Tax=Leishmania panamensis TaxID=5679 RepID=A0A088RMY1_LEIPA|nr:actin related protein 2/3 complex, putative [Leishmania panamensis]AIN97273.1 actin related protein 2/3 complex, putative [Leishmania panamensis]
MVSVSCVTCTALGSDSGSTGPRLASASPPLAALAFSHDSTLVAYAVRRGKALPRDGKCEDACCIVIANTNASAHCACSTWSVPGAAVAPFSQWTVLQILAGGHDAPITALAWCQRTGALLSTSADRGACVWVPRADAEAAKQPLQASKGETHGVTHIEGENARSPSVVSADAPFCAVPQLAVLSAEVRLCPTCVAWSAKGTKLYIGTSGGTVAVGRYDPRHKWWICRLLDDHRPTLQADLSAEAVSPSPTRACSVTALAAHPVENARLAVARLDGTVQVLSTHIKSVDSALGDAGRGAHGDSAGAAATPFSYVYLSHLLPCWVYGMAWSPSGQQLAVVGHDSGLHVWDWGAAPSSPLGGGRSSKGDCSGDGSSKCAAVHTAMWLCQLPLLRCEFASEDVLVAIGFEGRLCAFKSAAASTQLGVRSQRTWKMVSEHAVTQRVDGAQSAADASAHPPSSETAHLAATGRGDETTARGQSSSPSSSSSTNNNAAGCAIASSARQHVAERSPHTSPVDLLVRIPSSEKASTADSMDAMFVSAGPDGPVHLWRVCHTTITGSRDVPLPPDR